MTAAARFFSALRRQLARLTDAERAALIRAGARALTRISKGVTDSSA